jgi:mannosyltransferase OCH1-like enzyme
MNELKEHPNKAELLALADLKVVQARGKNDANYAWVDWDQSKSYTPLAPNDLIQWRVKPEPIPDWVVHGAAVLVDGLVKVSASFTSSRDTWSDNLRLTFDGETKKLKSADAI